MLCYQERTHADNQPRPATKMQTQAGLAAPSSSLGLQIRSLSHWGPGGGSRGHVLAGVELSMCPGIGAEDWRFDPRRIVFAVLSGHALA